jgi:hypothetical protein
VLLASDFSRIERRLPENWAEAQLLLAVRDAGRCDRAAALLGPANPGRRGSRIRFTVGRRGGGVGPDAVRRLLRRLDKEGIAGRLELVGVAVLQQPAAPKAESGTERRRSLRDEWELALATLPSDWSDLYAEVRLDSTDYLEPGALLLAPVNPMRSGRAGLRFRCARTFGYGVSAEMAARCLERCDEEGITGTVMILRALSDTYPVATQGPVWYIGGRSV